MNTTKDRKRRTIAEYKEIVRQNNLMKRYIREIEREEPLDIQILEMLLAYQTIQIR